jgi:tRNA threonylcarbamoyladenosine biosynthesis protein TsaB
VIILGIDSATPQVSVAIVGPDGTRAELAAVEGRRHGELLAPAIQRAAEMAGVGLGEINGVAADVGPGLFTGLRVGVATAQALASALGVPAIGVCSLDALAYPFRRLERPVAAVIDARRGEVFWALYRHGRRVVDPVLARPADVGTALANIDDVLAVGDGARRYRSELTSAELGDPSEDYPHAVAVAAIGAEGFAAGRAVAAFQLVPVYMRGADVRVGWEERGDAAIRPTEFERVPNG